MMADFESSWVALREEFRARPFGRHSPSLQALLNRLRYSGNGLNLLLVQDQPGRWLLAERLAAGEPPRLIAGKVYCSRQEAELDVFDMRLARLREAVER